MKKWIRFSISILLLAAVLLLHHSVVTDALCTLPESALASASPPISLTAFSETETAAPMTPVFTMPGYLETQAVTAHYTTLDAPAFYGLTMRCGDFTPWRAGSIVISDRLAVSLFLTDQAEGRTVRFNGQEYTVCGVYAEPDSLLSRISQTTQQAVYLPLAAYPNQDVAVSEWIVSLQDAQSAEHLAPEMEQQLGVNLTFRSAYHFSETRKLVQQSESMQIFVLALTFCLLSVWYTLRLEVKLIKAAKGSAFRDIFTKYRRNAIFFIVALGCVMIGIFWINGSAFPLFLPHDFILRSGSIVEYIVGNFQLTNEKAQLFLCAYAQNVKTVLAVLAAFAVVLIGKIAMVLFLRQNERG